MTNEPDPKVGGLEKTNRALKKTRSVLYAIWAYGFYGVLLILGISMLTRGESSGWTLVGGSVVLFILYWAFGYVLCIR